MSETDDGTFAHKSAKKLEELQKKASQKTEPFDRFVRIPVKDNRDIEALLKKLHATVWKERLTIHWLEEFVV